MFHKIPFFVTLIALLSLFGATANAADCRAPHKTTLTNKCSTTVVVPELVAGQGIISQSSIRNTTPFSIHYQTMLVPEGGDRDVSGNLALFISNNYDNVEEYPSTSDARVVTAAKGSFVITVTCGGVWNADHKTAVKDCSKLVTFSLMIVITAANSDILDAQDFKALKGKFLSLNPDGTSLWDAETESTRVDQAGFKWGATLTQSLMDRLRTPSSVNTQFHVLNLGVEQSVLVEVVYKNEVIATGHTPVLAPGATWGTWLFDLVGPGMFPKDLAVDSFDAELRFTGEARGAIVPWPKGVRAGAYLISKTPWVIER